MNETALKTAFAEALLRNPDDAFQAALSVIPDTGKALQLAQLWIRDPFVIEEQIRLVKDKGPKSFLPTKEDQAKAIYKLAEDANVDEEVRLKAHRLYAEIMGNIEKPVALPTTAIAVQNVMIVHDHGTDDNWEQKALIHQQKLIQGSLDAAN